MAMPADAAATVPPDVYVVTIGDEARLPAQVLTRDLRRVGLSALVDHEARSPRSQMKRADRVNAAHVLIVGGDELAQNRVSVKNMATGEQEAVSRSDVVERMRLMHKDNGEQ